MLVADRTFIETSLQRTGTDTACPLLSDDIADYPDGIIVPVDKPYRWTSADVVRKIKFAAVRHFRKKNLKVGHAGTLDPLATGVLLVCIGNATKKAEELQRHDKEYIAGITFGATTPSYDLEKEIDRMFPHGHITEELVRKILPDFIGEQDQIAPLFSAKSVDGVRAYEMARKLYRQQGGTALIDSAAAELIRTARIRIDEIELMEFRPGNGELSSGQTEASATAESSVEEGVPEKSAETTLEPAADEDPAADESQETAEKSKRQDRNLRINVTDNSHLGLPEALIRISCSKGTYIRAFARDLGEALQSGAHLCSLQRSRSGEFKVEDALDMASAVRLFI